MLRNFITILKRYTTASILNILGLSVALTAFYVIMNQVIFELNFDKFHKNADSIYKVELVVDGIGQTVVSRAFIDEFATSSPLIKSAAMVSLSWGKTYINVDINGNKVGFLEDIVGVYPSITEIFDFKMVEGSVKTFEEPTKMVLPLSKAKLMFGGEPALGKSISTQSGTVFEVGGVYEDFPENSQLNNNILTKVPENEGRNSDGSLSWGQNNYFMYVTLVKGANPLEVTRLFEEKLDLKKHYSMGAEVHSLLTPLSELYFSRREFVIEHLIKHGDKNTTNIMFSIAILILVIAAINFVNFATSLAPMRMKGINIKKVLGSTNVSLRLTLIFEAVFLCFVSYCLAIMMVYLLSKSSFQDITLSKITIEGNGGLMLLTGVIAIVLGVVSGIYPAIYTTNFSPAIALKGGVFRSRTGQLLRSTLIGVQFVISTILIIAAIFLQIQNNYMKSMDTGLPKESIVIAELGGKLAGNTTFENSLKESPNIEGVAYSQFNIGGGNTAQGWGRKVKGQSVMFSAHLVSWNFPELMGLTIVEGSSFDEGDSNKDGLVYVFNQTAIKQLGLTLDDNIGESEIEGTVIGIVKDFNFQSLHYEITPMALVLNKFVPLKMAYIKINGNPYEAVDHIKKAAKDIDPAFPLSINFYDQTFNNLYQKEQKSITLITLFSILTIIISLVGVFGLVIFETQFRRKEIGLRKINGASIGSILLMFNRKFIILTIICFAIAAPIAMLGVDKWLEEFAYRTPLEAWVFLVALLIITFITVTTVTVQSWRAATENPIKSMYSLKSE